MESGRERNSNTKRVCVREGVSMYVCVRGREWRSSGWMAQVRMMVGYRDGQGEGE